MINSIIFDLDGTVLDNEGEWEEAFREVARKHNLEKPKLLMPNGWWHEPGLGLEANWKRLVDAQKAELLARDTWVTYHKNFEENMGELKLREGITGVIEAAKERNWMIGLSTGSTWNVVEPELEQLNLYMAFDVTTTGEEVLVLKPDPEIYSLTVQKLETDPENCLVIEDAVAGIRAGIEAGCQVIGLASDYAPEATMRAAGANYVVSDISEIEKIIKGIE